MGKIFFVFCLALVQVQGRSTDKKDVEAIYGALGLNAASKAGFWVPISPSTSTGTVTTSLTIATATAVINCSPSYCCTYSCPVASINCQVSETDSQPMCAIGPFVDISSTGPPPVAATACVRPQCAGCSSAAVGCLAQPVCNDVTTAVCDFSRFRK